MGLFALLLNHRRALALAAHRPESSLKLSGLAFIGLIATTWGVSTTAAMDYSQQSEHARVALALRHVAPADPTMANFVDPNADTLMPIIEGLHAEGLLPKIDPLPWVKTSLETSSQPVGQADVRFDKGFGRDFLRINIVPHQGFSLEPQDLLVLWDEQNDVPLCAYRVRDAWPWAPLGRATHTVPRAVTSGSWPPNNFGKNFGLRLARVATRQMYLLSPLRTEPSS